MEFNPSVAQEKKPRILKVVQMKALRYLQASYLLSAMTLFSLGGCWVFASKTQHLWQMDATIGLILWNGSLSVFFLSLVFFSQLDAHSRFQEYKLIKDKFFEYGFDRRMLRSFVFSKCQRDAISLAAKEMDFQKEWKNFVQSAGFRWYHFIPHLVVRNPLILLTSDYWKKTLFVKTYHSKFFLW